MDDIYCILKKLSRKDKIMDWMLDNEEFMMFVVVPVLLLPVGWVVTKLLKTFEN